jgi:hypothetical protein
MDVFLLTPPFTQLNTPYPATAYLKGFLNTRNISSRQADLGIDVILQLFSRQGLQDLFDHIAQTNKELSGNAVRMLALRNKYLETIEPVIHFLQGKNPTFEHFICQAEALPQASRFDQMADLDWAFGINGTHDRAKHLATLFLDDLADLIQEAVDPYFGFSRYAERLGRCAYEFDALYEALHQEPTYIDRVLMACLRRQMGIAPPRLVAISVPFPGNLYAAFRCAEWIHQEFPSVKVALGGGYANTELRSLSDARVFEYVDFVCLDDGEAPIEHLFEYTLGKRPLEMLKRTFALVDGKVEYLNFSLQKDYKQSELGTPDYSDLPLDQYISVLETTNPMHRLWSDGRWNKLTMAHGCYWGKCTFCDISLDYIQNYEPLTAKLLCDRMETLIAETGHTGFHFVDEAAPPALMRALALEILRRKLKVSWWTNIRFEKSFTSDLCILLQASGCVAVSGGLEVASDRLLALIQKGVTVSQVAQVAHHFSEAGIMVHAYLMYGFPTQTAQETIDSLEMVRQMFELGIIQSGFWHQFALTAHSPVGLNPEKYGITIKTTQKGRFANNDLDFDDPSGAKHDVFSAGLKKSLYNFMHGIGFEEPLQFWFDKKIPSTKVYKYFIVSALQDEPPAFPKPGSKLLWLGNMPVLKKITDIKKGERVDFLEMTFHTNTSTLTMKVEMQKGLWLTQIFEKISPNNEDLLTLQAVKEDYQAASFDDFELFWHGKTLAKIKPFGLLSF